MSVCRPALVLLAIAFAAEPQHANRLAKESSPYLLQHAHNPVDWYPWGAEALARAKAENKLIFLSSGYSACHWCHVMERESFLDDSVAKLLNQNFVCIKLDREERPEVDHLYLTALNAMGSNGGWPLSMFLMPDGRPIAGGTYWPREDREIDGQTAAGFKTILKTVIEAQKSAPENLRKTAELRARQTKQLLAVAKRDEPVKLDHEIVIRAVSQLVDAFDEESGGFGTPPAFRGPKFPHPTYLTLLQWRAKEQKSVGLIVEATLEMMARGGVYDQLGGGFHRYATERTWTVPHFEKMLYDNAQLLEIYADEYSRSKNPLYHRVLEETISFVGRELTSKDGAFYTALDADSEGREGRYYVWTLDDVASAVKDSPNDLKLLKKTFGLDGQPNFENREYILVLQQPEEGDAGARLRELKRTLLAARSKRPRPNLDNKVLTSWNGLMIAGMARAGKAIDDPAAIDAARRAATFLLEIMKTPEGRLFHTFAAAPGEEGQPRVPGYLDDYTHLAHGLLALHDVTGEARWLDEAKALTDTMISLFHDEEGGAFFFTSAEHEQLFARMKDQYDGVMPCGNSQAAANFVALFRKTNEERYRKLAEETFRTFAVTLHDEPRSLCSMVTALGEWLQLKPQ